VRFTKKLKLEKKMESFRVHHTEKLNTKKEVLALGQTRSDLFWSLNVQLKYFFG
jgi:hypothetical protein